MYIGPTVDNSRSSVVSDIRSSLISVVTRVGRQLSLSEFRTSSMILHAGQAEVRSWPFTPAGCTNSSGYLLRTDYLCDCEQSMHVALAPLVGSALICRTPGSLPIESARTRGRVPLLFKVIQCEADSCSESTYAITMTL